jgi:hypothetical protein
MAGLIGTQSSNKHKGHVQLKQLTSAVSKRKKEEKKLSREIDNCAYIEDEDEDGERERRAVLARRLSVVVRGYMKSTKYLMALGFVPRFGDDIIGRRLILYPVVRLA